MYASDINMWRTASADTTKLYLFPSPCAVGGPSPLGEYRGWVEYYLEREIPVPLDNVAGSSVYFGGKHLMAYAQLCLVAEEMGRQVKRDCRPFGWALAIHTVLAYGTL